MQRDLLKHKLGLQKNRHTDIWIRIAETFHTHYQDDPRTFLKEHQHDAIEVLDALRVTHKDRFPYLGGPKLSNYWLYMLSRYTDVALKNMHVISIIPDTHVLQATEKLGLAQTRVTPEEAERLWYELLRDIEIAPVDMHPVLWNWSRNGFLPEV